MLMNDIKMGAHTHGVLLGDEPIPKNQMNWISRVFSNKNDAKTVKTLAKFLKSKGFEYAGSGFYAAVFTKGDIAAKIYANDPCYDSYIDYCAERWKSNKHLPRIYQKQKHNNVNVVVTERLQKLTRKSINYDPLLSYLHPDDVSLSSGVHRMHYRRMLVHLVNKYPELVKTDREISDLLAVGKCRRDLHIENVMIRPSTGDIVITDPIAKMWLTI